MPKKMVKRINLTGLSGLCAQCSADSIIAISVMGFQIEFCKEHLNQFKGQVSNLPTVKQEATK